MDAPEKKQCSRCFEYLELDEFAGSFTLPQGRQNWCRACFREYRRENRARINETKREWRDRQCTN